MTRRIFVFICLLFAVFLPAVSGAQQSKTVPKIGYLSASTRASHAPSYEAFLKGLRELATWKA
jgi:Skp family chaperone for outer membrane proteins